MKALGECSFLEKEHLEKVPHGIPVGIVTHCARVDRSPHVEIYYKEIIIVIPLST